AALAGRGGRAVPEHSPQRPGPHSAHHLRRAHRPVLAGRAPGPGQGVRQHAQLPADLALWVYPEMKAAGAKGGAAAVGGGSAVVTERSVSIKDLETTTSRGRHCPMRAAHGSRRRWSWAGALLLLAAALSWPGVAAAQEKVVKIGLALDFTRVYTFAIEEMHQGHRDYLELVNLRGGVNGWRFEPLVTDTGNEPQRGIEAYERFTREGALIFDFVSTPVSTAVLPRILEDQLVMVTPLTGRSDATDGTTFPWVFPMMATYWSKAAVIVQYMLDEAGGDLSGQRVALVHIDSPFGREPIPVLQTLSQRLGYTFQTFPYPSPGTEQSAVWTQVRRFQPDWILIWGAGPGQAVSLREAIRNGISMDKIISVTWLAEKDMEAVGAAAARGVRRFEPVVPGREPQVIQDILNEVYGAGRGHGDPSNVGATYYNI